MCILRMRIRNRKASTARKRMGQILSAGRSFAAKAYQLTRGRLNLKLKMDSSPGEVTTLVVLRRLFAKLWPQVSHQNPTTRPCLAPADPIPTIILTTPSGDVIPYEELPPWQKTIRPQSVRETQREWYHSEHLSSLNGKRFKPRRNPKCNPKRNIKKLCRHSKRPSKCRRCKNNRRVEEILAMVSTTSTNRRRKVRA